MKTHCREGSELAKHLVAKKLKPWRKIEYILRHSLKSCDPAGANRSYCTVLYDRNCLEMFENTAGQLGISVEKSWGSTFLYSKVISPQF